MPRVSKAVGELSKRGLPLALGRRLALGQSTSQIRDFLADRFAALAPSEIDTLMALGERAREAAVALGSGGLSAGEAATRAPVLGTSGDDDGSGGRYIYEVNVPWETADGALSGDIWVRITSDTPLTHIQINNRGFNYWLDVQSNYPERFGGVAVTDLVVYPVDILSSGRSF